MEFLIFQQGAKVLKTPLFVSFHSYIYLYKWL